LRTLAVLGATGSIGRQALDLIGRHPENFKASVLTAYQNHEALFDLVRAFRPAAAGLVAEPKELPEDVRFCSWYFGEDCSERALLDHRPDDALAAVVGVAGLGAVLTALETCERVLLANKEALVTAGDLVTEKARKLGKKILPVDSEHSAIFQCLEAANGNPPAKLILTASGGPFRTWDKKAIQSATVADALGHPTWRMGKKITVDCATMMNKGLEVIEAHHLFQMKESAIDVVVHPQSVIHSMVQFQDGAVLAQLGAPDMRGPIGYAMGYPDRLSYGAAPLDFTKLQLTFEAPDEDRFPCLALARQALRAGGSAPVVLNGANEAAVEAFLQERIPFGDIARLVDATLQQVPYRGIESYDAVREVDLAARLNVKEALKRME
jgi:1-deoxy-D-xylulose-5-phosphate reductoisomerase